MHEPVSIATLIGLIERVLAWAERTRPFSAQQIRLTRRVLAERDWIASAGF